jgi:hypothetical protein
LASAKEPAPLPEIRMRRLRNRAAGSAVSGPASTRWQAVGDVHLYGDRDAGQTLDGTTDGQCR